MRVFLISAVRASIAVGVLAVIASCSGSKTNEYPCAKDTDCAVYGSSAKCTPGGSCVGAGTLCATQAGIDGRTLSAGPGSPSVAVTFDEMSGLAQSLYDVFCGQVNACIGAPSSAACEENEPDVQITSCCKGMLDFYVAHRSEIMACATATLPCGAPQLSAFCAPLATLLDPGCDKG